MVDPLSGMSEGVLPMSYISSPNIVWGRNFFHFEREILFFELIPTNFVPYGFRDKATGNMNMSSR